MADTVVVTDDDSGDDSGTTEVVTETVIEQAGDIGQLQAIVAQNSVDITALSEVVGSVAAQLDGLDDRVSAAFTAAWDAQIMAGEAKIEAEEAEAKADEAASETPEESDETEPPPPPDEPPNSKVHGWWKR